MYLNTLSVLVSLTTQRDVPSVTMSLGLVLPLFEAEAAGRVLAAGEAAGGAGVLEDLVLLGIDDPDVGAVGGDALERGVGGQAAGRPGAEQRAAGVVDVDVLVGVHDPDGCPGGGAGGAARGGVAAVQGVVLDGGAAAAVLVGPVGAAVVDHVELGRVVVEDRADALAVGDGGADRVRQVEREGLGRLAGGIVERSHEDRHGRRLTPGAKVSVPAAAT